MDLLGMSLYVVPIVADVVCTGWFISFIDSQQKKERSILRWREMSPAQKALIGLVSVWICLNFYLAAGRELALLKIALLPLSWIYSQALPVDLWGTTATIIVLVSLFQLRCPRRPITA